MLQFIVAIILLEIFLFSLQTFFTKLATAEKVVVYFLSGCAHVILALEIASLFSSIDQPYAILLIQFIFTFAIFLILRKRLVFPKKESINIFVISILNQIKRHPYIAFYLFLITTTYGFLFFLLVQFPQNTGDSLYNHLSRIGYWLQQGSLQPYSGFNDVGATYPYNNSLLMLWSVVFLRSDKLVGSVQFIATMVCAVIIYCIAIDLGFERKCSLIASLVFLSFPIILFQAITAQNDMLAASYIGAGFLFLIRSFKANQKINLVLSGLAFGLALGTKQYAFFALPGYLALVIIVVLKDRSRKLRLFSTWMGSIAIFATTVGSYCYIQNAIYHRSVLGEVRDVNYSVIINPPRDMLQKVVVNSARLFTQFISCDGLPPDLANSCNAMKGTVLKPLFVNNKINIESSSFLLEQDTPFNLTTPYPLNEESAWFGPLSWIIMLPGLFYGIYFSITHKRLDAIILILTCLIFFVAIASFKNGWDPYLGRHLITIVVLLMPFTAFVFSQKRFYNNLLLGIIGFASIFIATFSIINNVSRPLIGAAQFYRTTMVVPVYGDISYRLVPLFPNLDNVWKLNRDELRTQGDRSLLIPIGLVTKHVPEDAALGIVAQQGNFYDYLFFGESFNQIIIPIINGDTSRHPDYGGADYLLITPEYVDQHPLGFKQIAEQNSWRILERIN